MHFLEKYGTAIFTLVLIALLITVGPVVAKEINGRLFNEVKNLPKATNVVADEDDPSLVHNDTIPEGGVYTSASGTVYNTGDEFPTGPRYGDTYEYEGLYYTYYNDSWDECKELYAVQAGMTLEEFNQMIQEMIDAGEIESEEEIKNNFINPLQSSQWCVTDANTKINTIKILKNINKVNVTIIGCRTFEGCTSLKSINLPESVTSIGILAFYNCTSLTTINISNNITKLDKNIFANCTNLITIVIPDSVTSIVNSAFNNCTSLQTIYYKGTATGAPWGATNATIVSDF